MVREEQEYKKQKERGGKLEKEKKERPEGREGARDGTQLSSAGAQRAPGEPRNPNSSFLFPSVLRSSLRFRSPSFPSRCVSPLLIGEPVAVPRAILSAPPPVFALGLQMPTSFGNVHENATDWEMTMAGSNGSPFRRVSGSVCVART